MNRASDAELVGLDAIGVGQDLLLEVGRQLRKSVLRADPVPVFAGGCVVENAEALDGVVELGIVELRREWRASSSVSLATFCEAEGAAELSGAANSTASFKPRMNRQVIRRDRSDV